MKSIFLPLALFASAAVAATQTAASAASTTTCGAEYIVDACLDGEEAKRATCKAADYECQCNSYINLLTCFNNCPDDTRRGTYDGQKQIYCSYATQFPNSTTSKAHSASGTSAAASATASATSGGGDDAASSSSSSGHKGSSGEATITGSRRLPVETASSDAGDKREPGRILAVAVGLVVAAL